MRNIRIDSNIGSQFVDTRLVSAPLKLRRARITKFDVYNGMEIHVRQGQVARLPCYGLPDVVPGPPEMWFEKHNNENIALGQTGVFYFLLRIFESVNQNFSSDFFYSNFLRNLFPFIF